MINAPFSALLQVAPDVVPLGRYALSLGDIFLLFFIMLGPIKMLAPFFVATSGLEPAALRSVSWKVFGYSVVAVILVGLVGSALMTKWHIEPVVMQLAGGLVFLLAALKTVLSIYRAPAPPPAAAPAPIVHQLVYPVTVPPYGIAALITLMALSQDMSRSMIVLGLALFVMVLNLIGMLAVRWLMHGVGPIVLQFIGAVLGIMQVALALQLILAAWRSLGPSPI